MSAPPLCAGLFRRDDILHLDLRDSDPQPVLAGAEIAVELAGARECIGSRQPGEDPVPCPQHATGASSNQCPECFERSLMLPCLRCDGERCANPARRADCVQPENHAVYLAAFAPGMYKVGVARWERRQQRLAEQGARAAIIIARDDGQLVRRVESQIKRLRGETGEPLIPDRRNMHEKLHGLTQAGTQEQLAAELRDVWPLIRPRVLGTFLADPEPVTLPELERLALIPRVISAHADLRLRGTVSAVCGQTIIVDSDSGEQVAIDASGLVGYRIRALGADEVGVGQLALSF